MLVRDIKIQDSTIAEATQLVSNAFRCRGCAVTKSLEGWDVGDGPDLAQQNANRQIENRQIENRQIEDQQYSYTHLQGVYSLVAGSGPILFVDKGNHIVIRFGLEINSTTFGLAIITLALVAALPTLGLSYLLVVFANDFAATSVVGELERLTHECVSNSMAQQEIKQPG